MIQFIKKQNTEMKLYLQNNHPITSITIKERSDTISLYMFLESLLV